jgi:hypothetical protein
MEQGILPKVRPLVMGRIVDDRGNRMSPSHSRRGAARHRYCVSSALIQGQPLSAGSVARVPAARIEAVVLDAVRRHIGHDAPIDNTELITTYVRRIEVRRTEIAISLWSSGARSARESIHPFSIAAYSRPSSKGLPNNTTGIMRPQRARKLC